MDFGRLWFAIFLVLLTVLTGCSNEKGTYPVKGTLTLASGQPLANASISMEATEGSLSATGGSDANGRFEMSTYSFGDGMPRGTYRALVIPPSGDDPDVRQPKLFDPKYSSYQTSGLQFTIEGAVEDLEIRLK